jgi:glutathione synthase/RimK-type ligase-like ATP-grasp enzyme
VILIAGGEADFNITSILRRMEERGMAGERLLVGPGSNPGLTWDFQTGRLTVDGRETAPEAVFIRYDVFTHMADPRPATAFRAQAWFNTLHGWMLAHDGVRMLNRRYRGQANKPYMLDLARRVGLPIPSTLITNELDALDALAAGAPMIAKPVPGGGYTQLLEKMLADTERRDGRSAAPGIVQQRLVAPEVRIYGVGGRFIAFHVQSEALDYRADDATRVVHLPIDTIDPELIAALGRLMDALEMDYGASDFKTDPDTGQLRFLEINSSPMFAAFDAASGFAVSDAILDYLAPR